MVNLILMLPQKELLVWKTSPHSVSDPLPQSQHSATMDRRAGRLLLPLFLSVFLLSTTSAAHNITALLSSKPDFSMFNHYLSLTHLSYDINSRNTITILALDNSTMSALLAPNPSLGTIKNILSLHVLLDYFDSVKLHQLPNGTSLTATLFQTTGQAPGSSGYVNITDLAGGKVGFGPPGGKGDQLVFFIKALVEVPYNISVLQVSGPIPSDVAAAPVPSPAWVNITEVMGQKGCGVYGATLSGTPDALSAYQDNIEGGLTVFCPLDNVFKPFLPRFKNLSSSGQVSFLEFYGVPVYQSLSMLRSDNGPTNTLATNGPGNFDFTIQNDGQDVTLKSKVNTVKIKGTLLDQQPVAIFLLDGVLLPEELFASAPTPAPAPAPVPSAESPTAAKANSPPAPPSESETPADSPAGDAADQTPTKSLGVKVCGGMCFECIVMSLSSLVLMLVL